MRQLEQISFSQRERYVYIKGRERIVKYARDYDYPSFLLEAAVLENPNCRRFARSRENQRIMLIIDFDPIGEQSLKAITKKRLWTSVPSFCLIDHINIIDFQYRFLGSLVGSPVSNCPPQCLLDGEASPNAFPLTFNDINGADPFFGLSDKFLVYEKGNVYQWKFATLGNSKITPGHTAFFSPEVDLEPFERSVAAFHSEINGSTPSLDALIKGYSQVVRERAIILERLLDLHKKKKKQIQSPGLTSKPPRLGRFDYLHINQKDYAVSTDVAPILYETALKHLTNAMQSASSESHPDQTIGDCISGILLSYLCLEAHINGIGNSLAIPNWSNIVEKSPLEAKIGKITNPRRDKRSLWKVRPDMKRDLKNLINLRNELVHYKRKKYKAVEMKGALVSDFHKRVSTEQLALALEVVRKTIIKTHDHIGMPVPLWLEKRLDWLENLDPAVLLGKH